MSMQNDPDDFQQQQQPRNFRRELEDQARTAQQEAATAKAELEALKRERAFDQAGVPTDKVGALFRKAFDGPVDDLAAIKAAAAEYGIIDPATQQRQDQIDRSLAGHQQASAAATGGQAPPPDDVGAELDAIFNKYGHAKSNRTGAFDDAKREIAQLMHSRGYQVEEQRNPRATPR